MEPALIEGLDDVNIVKLACGDSISIALSSDGKVYSWGSFRVSKENSRVLFLFL
jgi:regulator of chromosome condensation